MKMKKLLATATVIALAFGLAACGDDWRREWRAAGWKR